MKKRWLTDKKIEYLLRWWSASAVYFFIGWGTGLGQQSTIIDFVFFLGIVMGIFEMFIVNPIIGLMLNTGKKQSTAKVSVVRKVIYRLGYFLQVYLILIWVVIVYDIINMVGGALMGLEADQVFLPGEPILFGVFYIMTYILVESLKNKVRHSKQEEMTL